MKPFNPRSKCPKCGHGKVRTLYEPPIEQDPLWYDRTYKPTFGHWPRDEFIKRTCERCDFAWPEAVLASLPRKEEG